MTRCSARATCSRGLVSRRRVTPTPNGSPPPLLELPRMCLWRPRRYRPHLTSSRRRPTARRRLRRAVPERTSRSRPDLPDFSASAAASRHRINGLTHPMRPHRRRAVPSERSESRLGSRLKCPGREKTLDSPIDPTPSRYVRVSASDSGRSRRVPRRQSLHPDRWRLPFAPAGCAEPRRLQDGQLPLATAHRPGRSRPRDEVVYFLCAPRTRRCRASSHRAHISRARHVVSEPQLCSLPACQSVHRVRSLVSPPSMAAGWPSRRSMVRHLNVHGTGYLTTRLGSWSPPAIDDLPPDEFLLISTGPGEPLRLVAVGNRESHSHRGGDPVILASSLIPGTRRRSPLRNGLMRGSAVIHRDNAWSTCPGHAQPLALYVFTLRTAAQSHAVHGEPRTARLPYLG